jgi:hypothetical protein
MTEDIQFVEDEQTQDTPNEDYKDTQIYATEPDPFYIYQDAQQKFFNPDLVMAMNAQRRAVEEMECYAVFNYIARAVNQAPNDCVDPFTCQLALMCWSKSCVSTTMKVTHLDGSTATYLGCKFAHFLSYEGELYGKPLYPGGPNVLYAPVKNMGIAEHMWLLNFLKACA